MFDLGFLEMVVVAVVALLVLGPDKLPGAVRTVGLYVGLIKRDMEQARSQVEREIRADELCQTLHNEKLMADLAKQPTTSHVRRTQPDATAAAPSADAAAPSAEAVEPAPGAPSTDDPAPRSEEHTSELQSRENLVCRLLLETKSPMRCQRPSWSSQIRPRWTVRHSVP